MRGGALWVWLTVGTVSVSVVSGVSGAAAAPLEEEADQYIVVLDARADGAEVAARNQLGPKHVYTDALRGFAGHIPPGQLKKLLSDPAVAWVEVDTQVQTAGKGGGKPPPPPAPAQVVPTGVSRIQAHLNPKAKIDGLDERVNVDVAIVDTGIELKHPDLYVYKNVSCILGIRTGNDDHGHGTHVAGIAGALDNAIGVVGVAPGARLWAVKVLRSDGTGLMSDVIKGVDYVTKNAGSIEVANLSLAGADSPSLKTAIANSVAKGVVYVVAAGNDGSNAGLLSPANSPDVLCVSAVVDTDGTCGQKGAGSEWGSDDAFATFSNWGAVVDIAAPGVNILSTYRGGGYGVASGTSMASPHVTGAVALYLSGQPKPRNALEAALVRQAILDRAIGQNVFCDNQGVGGFVADPDASPEPLVHAAGL
ncbi:MAG: peptidase S8 [Verrucomicrobia bacterium]|nr:peptidase S8 [Verrucomicrobiota bacterium]